MFTMGPFWNYTLVEAGWWGLNMAETVSRSLGITQLHLSVRVMNIKFKDGRLEEL